MGTNQNWMFCQIKKNLSLSRGVLLSWQYELGGFDWDFEIIWKFFECIFVCLFLFSLFFFKFLAACEFGFFYKTTYSLFMQMLICLYDDDYGLCFEYDMDILALCQWARD